MEIIRLRTFILCRQFLPLLQKHLLKFSTISFGSVTVAPMLHSHFQ